MLSTFKKWFGKAEEPQPEPKVVQAVMSSVSVGAMETPEEIALARVLEDAEVAAVKACITDGIPLDDADRIISRKKAFREVAYIRWHKERGL